MHELSVPAIARKLRHLGKKKVANIVFSDAGKVFFGSAVAIVLAMFLPLIAKATMGASSESTPEPTVIEQVVE